MYLKSNNLQFYINSSDSPEGYHPIPKDTVPQYKNICEFCDWRKDCNGFLFSCMADKRKDGIGVVFKKIV